MGGHKQTEPLGETFFTQVPLRFGDYIAKLSLAPVSASLTSLKDRPLPEELADDPDGLRHTVNKFFTADTGEWELRAQLNTDLDKMPIEDASVEWSQEDSPYIAVARVRVGPQVAFSERGAQGFDDRLSFNPWHGLEAHQPLGGVMRARRSVYAASVAYRGAANGCPMHEPASMRDVAP